MSERIHMRYQEQADLALQITDDKEQWYKIIKNRSDVTEIDPSVSHITKAVIPNMLEGKLKIVILDDIGRVKINNFFLKVEFSSVRPTIMVPE